jgi:hypothetical protein
MNTHNQRGVVHILLLAVLVLVALSAMARCDIDNATANELTPQQEHSDAMEPNSCQRGNNPAGAHALRRSL